MATTGAPLPEKEFTFIGEPKLAKGIANAGFDVLALANNHMGDYGDRCTVGNVRSLKCKQASVLRRGTRPPNGKTAPDREVEERAHRSSGVLQDIPV